MIVVHLTLRLRAPWCRSLKDRRSEVKRLIAKLRGQFNISVSETGKQDTWTMFEIGIAALAFDAAQADGIAESIAAFVERSTEAELLSIDDERL